MSSIRHCSLGGQRQALAVGLCVSLGLLPPSSATGGGGIRSRFARSGSQGSFPSQSGDCSEIPPAHHASASLSSAANAPLGHRSAPRLHDRVGHRLDSYKSPRKNHPQGVAFRGGISRARTYDLHDVNVAL